MHFIDTNTPQVHMCNQHANLSQTIKQTCFELLKACMLISAHETSQVEHAMASAKVNMLSHTKKTGDSLADLYVPIMINTIAVILVRLAAATIHAFPLAHAAIRTSMQTEAKAAANLPPDEKLEIMLTAAQTALGKFEEAAMRHAQHV